MFAFLSGSSKNKNTLSIVILLANTCLMWFGFFMLIPLLAVHITRELALGAGMAGLVLAVRQFVQQGLGLFAGPLADWVGYREMMMAGLLVRAAGFAWLAVATEPVGLMMGGIVAALGGAGFESSSKAGLAAVSKGYSRQSVFSLSSTVGNIGMATGPMVGVFLIQVNFTIVGLTSAAIYLVALLLLWLFVPHIARPATNHQGRPGPAQIFGKLGIVWKNTAFVLICIMLIGFYFLYVQINITMPLVAIKITGSDGSVGVIYTLNSGMAIFLQFFSVKMLGKWLQPVTLIGLGTALTASGLFCLIFANDYLGLILCVVIYGSGRLIVEPVAFALTAKYATDETMASYFGFSSLALAFGGMLGNSLGGWLFDTGYDIGYPSLCWIVFGVVGGAVVLGVIWFKLSGYARDKSNRITPGSETILKSS